MVFAPGTYDSSTMIHNGESHDYEQGTMQFNETTNFKGRSRTSVTSPQSKTFEEPDFDLKDVEVNFS